MLGQELPKSFVDELNRVCDIGQELYRKLERCLAGTLMADGSVKQLADALKRLAAEPLVPGYVPFLIQQGSPAFEARLIDRAIHHYGVLLVQEERAERSLASALRAVSRVANASTLVIARRAKALCNPLCDPCVAAALSNACHDAGHPELADELSVITKKAADRDPAACRVLTRSAARLLPCLPDPRGRPVAPATAMHELLLDELHSRGKPRAFTWSAYDEAFVDIASKATQIAAGDPDFDPRPASRRRKARLVRAGSPRPESLVGTS